MADLATMGVLVALVGIGVMIASVASHEKGTGGDVRGGAVVMIGPVPIIFGSDAKWASAAIILAVILMLVALLALVV